MDCSPWGSKESDTTERLSLSSTSEVEISKHCHLHIASGKLKQVKTEPFLQGSFVFQSMPVSEYVVYHINLQTRAVNK